MSTEPPIFERETLTVDAPKPAPARPADWWRTVGHWLRDTGLGLFGFALVLTVAGAGWSASFLGLHDFGQHHMGLSGQTAWLVPITFDGAPAGLSIVVARASIHGRTAPLWRFLIIAFTCLSSWINYQHIDDSLGRTVAAFMPPSAVILFEGLMSEVRAAAVRRTGQERPRLHPLRWWFDFAGTKAIYRAYVLGIELPDALKEAAGEVASDGSTAALPATESTENPSTGTPTESATEDATPVDRIEPGSVDGKDRPEPTPAVDRSSVRTGDGTTVKASTGRRRNPARPAAGKKAPRRSLSEWVDLAAPIFHAEFDRLKRMPTANEFATAIRDARLGIVSDTRAKSIRAEILDRAPLPSLDGES